MPERFARIAALALVVVLILALPLLFSLFNSLNAPAPTRTPTVVAVAQPSPTFAQPTNFPSPLPPTLEPTVAPLSSPTAGCIGPATPEPLWVDPVLSPTNLLSQKITVTLGRGREISVTSEAGTVSQQGEFSTARPVELEVPLVPNATNNLLVVGRVEYAPECFYTLQTRVDRIGNPLVIVQQGGTLGVNETATPAAPGTVYLKPFAQVFALNQDAPTPADQLWLYTAPNPNSAFQVLDQQGAFTHLLSQGGTLHFWTLNDNVVTTPAPSAQYDDSVNGARVEFIGESFFACEAQYPTPLILGLCTELQGVTEGEAVQRAQVGGSTLYLVRINNRLYWVSSTVLKQEPQ